MATGLAAILSRRPTLPSLALALLAGCASEEAARARQAYFSRELAAVECPEPCIEQWPSVVKLLAAQGYSFVGGDRLVAGQPPQGSFAQTVSAGFLTRGTGNGGLAVGTDWNERWTRYVAPR